MTRSWEGYRARAGRLQLRRGQARLPSQYPVCEPTAHRRAFSDSSSFSFRRLGPTAHRLPWWRRRLPCGVLVRLFLLIAALAAPASRCWRLRGKPGKLVGKHALRCPMAGLGRNSPALLPTGSASWDRHQSASKVSVPADIQGGDEVADETPSGLNDVLSVRTYARGEGSGAAPGRAKGAVAPGARRLNGDGDGI